METKTLTKTEKFLLFVAMLHNMYEVVQQQGSPDEKLRMLKEKLNRILDLMEELETP